MWSQRVFARVSSQKENPPDICNKDAIQRALRKAIPLHWSINTSPRAPRAGRDVTPSLYRNDIHQQDSLAGSVDRKRQGPSQAAARKTLPKSALPSAYPHACPQTDNRGLQEQLSGERTQSFHLSSGCRINASQREEPHPRGFLVSFIFPSITRHCRAASCSAGKVPPASHPKQDRFPWHSSVLRLHKRANVVSTCPYAVICSHSCLSSFQFPWCSHTN